jgi:uncharacterized protein YdeI (YjbR/CyaY-like superfamily)
LLFWAREHEQIHVPWRAGRARSRVRHGMVKRTKTAAVFFAGPDTFRAWLRKNHLSARELLVGFHKRHTGTRCMTWPESVAEALCFGWIDGLRKRLDDERYTIRFTPRRNGGRGGRWSAINIRMVATLEAAGRMTDAGRVVFAARANPEFEGYSTRRREATLDAARLRAFRKNRRAWAFFGAQPPGYRRLMCWWIMTAKREETRDRRLARIVAASGAGMRLNWAGVAERIPSNRP